MGKDGKGGRKVGWCEPPHPSESGGSIPVIPRPGATFDTQGDSSMASSPTTGLGPRGVDVPSPCRGRRLRMCGAASRQGGRIKPIIITMIHATLYNTAGDAAGGQLQLSTPVDKYGCLERRRRYK